MKHKVFFLTGNLVDELRAAADFVESLDHYSQVDVVYSIHYYDEGWSVHIIYRE